MAKKLKGVITRKFKPPIAKKLKGVITRKFKPPTQTERALQQSLPESLRKLPVQEVVRRQTISGGQTRAPTQTLVSQRIKSASQRIKSASQRLLAQQQERVGKGKETASQQRAKEIAKRQALKIRATQERIQKRIIRRQQRLATQSFARAEDLFRAGQKKVSKPFTRIPKFKRLDTIKAKGLTTVDVITGGRITQSQINKKQENLNKDIGSFNKDFGNVSLTKSQFNRAKTIQADLEQRSQALDLEQQKLFGSKRFKFAESLTLEKRKPLTQAEVDKNVKDRTRELENIQKEISDAKKSESRFKNINLKRLQALEKGKRQAISSAKAGKRDEIVAGEFPLIPASRIPRGVTTVLFSGKQRVKGGKIITDIIFKTSRGQVGLARGVTVTQEQKGFSVIAGRTGKATVKFPSGKTKVKGIRGFVGKEVTQTKPISVEIEKTIDILRKKKTIARVRQVKKNIQALQQRGVGEIGTFRGNKILRSRLLGKRKKKVQLDELASIAAIFTRRKLSLIIGKSITRANVKANFIGVIKGDKSLKSISFKAGEKQQFQKALSQIISASASAIAKAERSGAVARDVKIATASAGLRIAKIKTELVKPIIIKVPSKAAVVQAETKIKTINKNITGIKEKSRITQKQITVSKTKQQQLTTQISQTKSKQAQKQLQKQKTQQKAKQTLLQKQLQKQKQKQRLLLKQIQVQVQRIRPPRVPVPRILPVRPTLPRVKRKKKKVTKKPKPKKAQPVFNVFGKARGKFVKLNVKPLRRGDALSKGAFAVDQTTARTFKIESAGKSKKPGKLLKGERNYFNRQGFKLREVKIRKGRKFKLKNKFIEKTKHAIDTKSEKKGLTIAKLIKQQRVPTPAKARKILMDKTIRGRPLTPKQRKFFQARANTRKRTQTPTQRKTMLKNLEKARRVRKQKLDNRRGKK